MEVTSDHRSHVLLGHWVLMQTLFFKSPRKALVGSPIYIKPNGTDILLNHISHVKDTIDQVVGFVLGHVWLIPGQ